MMMMRHDGYGVRHAGVASVSLAAIFLLFTPSAQAAETYTPYQQLITNADHLSDTDRLQKLFQIDWARGVRESPEFATDLGVAGEDDRWTDMSEAAIAERNSEGQWPLNVLKTINRTALAPPDQLNYDLFLYDVETGIADNHFPGQYLPVDQLGGVQQDIPQVIMQMPTGNLQAYENILSRLRAAPALIDQIIALMRHGVQLGITKPKIIMQKVPEQVLKVIPDDPMASSLLKPFTTFPDSIPQPDRDRLKAEAIKIYHDQLAPAYRRLHDYLAQDYIPHARDNIAWSALPDGAAWYKQAIRQHTTTDMTPEEIHALGLSEVVKDHAEMEQVAATSGFKGNYDAFVNFLRTDPQFYYTDAESLLAGYRNIAKQIDPVLPEFFGKLPRLTYGVRAIAPYAAESAPAAYYMSGSVKTGRPGWFCANTSNLPSRPKWQMAVLTLHESVPGHHLQLSLAQEQQNVPEFRKFDSYTAFAEGWALYCERLGGEMGFYKDPYSRFGQLTFDMWRACRLVVDTGIHSEGWSRRQAVDYLMANAGKDEHDATVEVDRYIASPGQALAYKIGQLKFLAIRKEAEEQLGPAFDLRAFHDALLANGSLPLPVLQAQMQTWIANTRASVPKPAPAS
jgi:uncharacterized protein (DUF885 family)